MNVSIPENVLAGCWIPFSVIALLTFLFAWIYIRLFQHNELSEISTTMTSVCGLFIVLLTCALVPIDVFIVSLMKLPDGSFQDWAATNSTRQSIEDMVTYTYYALYTLVAIFIFILLPFMYFYFEDKDDDQTTTKQRCCTGFKYMLGFLFIASAILLTGAFVPLKKPPANTTIEDKFNFLKDELQQYSHSEKAMSIMIGVISMFGMMTLVMYTGYGMSALPLSMIRCCKKFQTTGEDNERRMTRHERDMERARMIRAKQNSGRNLTRFERNELFRIEKDEQLQSRIARKKRKMKTTVMGKFLTFLKPFEVVFGMFFMTISLLIMISLTVTSIDKAIHSSADVGYTLVKPTLPNPVNFVMVYAQKVFPLDYILFAGMALFFIFASMSGMKRIGIWCCCIKMYKIRVGRTLPQALVFMVFILMFTVLALNIVLFTVSPQYLQYGNQKYQVNITSSLNGTKSWRMESKTCSTSAPDGECVMSRLALILNTLFYKAWFFGAFYYWSIWLFIGLYYIGLAISLVKLFRKRPEEEMVSSSESDDSDDDSESGRLIPTA